MVPSAVPKELTGLTQVEEMLIARALPIIHVYIKPGGQRGFSGHCINIPQNIRELAHSLPRYPKDLPVIVVQKKGKGNDFKNLVVRRQVVSDAIHWLSRNNPLYSDIEINYNALVSLPENEVPQQLLSIQTDEKVIHDTLNCAPDRGPVYEEEDNVYNTNVDTSSFLPVNNSQQQEEHSINQQVFQSHIDWPSSSDNPLNEFTTAFWAKYQLLRYKPWKTTPQDAWGNKQENDELFVSEWKTLLQSDYAQNYVPDWHDKLEDLQEYSDLHVHTEESTESEQREEWMILADFSISNNSSDAEASSLHDWQTNSYPYTSQQKTEMPSWIISKKQTYVYQTLNNPYNNININSFSDMQALAYNLVKEHFESSSQELPLL